MKILVTGATSIIGQEVIALLLEKGHEIRSLTRQFSVPSILNKTDIRIFDLENVPKEIAEGIDTVIHIAAATPGANSSAEDYRHTNIEGTRHLIKICEEQHLQRFLFISSIVVLYEENKDDYTLSKKEAETIITKSSLDWTILRPAEILGADKSWRKFLQILRNKKNVMVPGNGNQLRHPVFFRDVVNAIVQVLENKNTYGKKYTLATARPVTYYQFLKIIKKIYKLNYRIITIPLWLIKTISFFNPLLPGKVKRKINNASGMMRSIDLDIQNAIQDFNYHPADFESGLQDLAGETLEY